MTQKSFMAKGNEVERKYYLIDATDKTLGKLAVKAADLLRGKHKPTYTPHVDTGDYVVIINAEKVKVTGKKFKDKEYQRYTGYHSGQRTLTFEELITKAPTKPLELAIFRMIPSGPLGNKVKTKLKIYAGDNHPHKAQKPELIKI